MPRRRCHAEHAAPQSRWDAEHEGQTVNRTMLTFGHLPKYGGGAGGGSSGVSVSSGGALGNKLACAWAIVNTAGPSSELGRYLRTAASCVCVRGRVGERSQRSRRTMEALLETPLVWGRGSRRGGDHRTGRSARARCRAGRSGGGRSGGQADVLERVEEGWRGCGGDPKFWPLWRTP